ncbi:MAG: hypothetical protein KDB27_01000 [Planctomycetales bacterium]|nr:hypothetical protein [Planctomycetales bacterium]
MKYSQILATGALAFFAICSEVYSVDGLERQSTPDMEAHTDTDARVYKDNVLMDSDPGSDDEVLYTHHNNSLQVAAQSGGWASYSDADGNGNALVNADALSTCDVAAGATANTMSFSSSGEYYTYVQSTVPYYSSAPVFRSEADSEGNAWQISVVKQKSGQAKTVLGTLQIEASRVKGATELAYGSLVDVAFADSDLNGMYLGDRWTVFGTLQQKTTSNPNASPVTVLYTTSGRELFHLGSASQVITSNALFEVQTSAKNNSIKAVSTSHNPTQDETSWELNADLTVAVF